MKIPSALKNDWLKFETKKGEIQEAGLPGIPIKLAMPDSRIILVESRRRRANFLKQVVRQLALEDVEIVNARVESWRPDANKAEVVVARAVKQPDKVWSLVQSCLTDYGALVLTLASKEGLLGPLQ